MAICFRNRGISTPERNPSSQQTMKLMLIKTEMWTPLLSFPALSSNQTSHSGRLTSDMNLSTPHPTSHPQVLIDSCPLKESRKIPGRLGRPHLQDTSFLVFRIPPHLRPAMRWKVSTDIQHGSMAWGGNRAAGKLALGNIACNLIWT